MVAPAKKISATETQDDKDDSDAAPAHGRSLWSGSIAFGLVQIPVTMHVAERGKELAFHQLDKHDHARIRYERVNGQTGKPVAWNDIVKGYEISRDNYVVVLDEDFEKANVEATHTIDIQDFVDRAEIPIEYFERPYYLVPEKNSKHAYGVLRDALAEKGLVAITLVVIRTRQRLASIIPDGNALVLVTMRFGSELVPVSSVAADLPKETHAKPKEIELAMKLVDTLTTKWDPRKYTDTYSRDLLAAIHEKAEKGTITAPNGERGHAVPTNVLDLVSLLQKSVAQTAREKPAHPGPKKTSGSRRKSA